MKFKHLRGFVFTVFVSFLTLTAHATMVSEVSIADLSKNATLIFVGTCQQRTTALQPFLTGRVPVTTYTFQVKDVLKKPASVAIAANKTFQFAQQGGDVADADRAPDILIPFGAVQYQVGQEYMLFLGANKSGKYMPIGLHQGRLTVATGADGRKSVSNGAYTAKLFRGVAAPAGKHVSKSAASLLSGATPAGEGVALDTMKDIVNALQGH